MSVAARRTLHVFRNDPLYLALSIEGEDLSDAVFAFAIGLYPGAPPLIELGMTTTPGATGIRIVGVVVLDGVTFTLLEIIAAKASIQALPQTDEAGADSNLSYDLQWTPATGTAGFSPVESTRVFGPFIIRESVND